MATNDDEAGATIERYGVSPGTAFGDVPTDRVEHKPEYGSREYIPDDTTGIGDVGGSNVGADINRSAHTDDGFERNPDGSYRLTKDGQRRRKRGGKSGGRRNNERGSKATSSNVLTGDAIGALLITACGVVSTTFAAPEWSMDEDEGKKIGQATANVVRHYDYVLTPKQYDSFVFAMAITPAVGLRFVMMLDRLKQERLAKARNVNPQPKPASKAAPAASPSVPSPTPSASPGVNAAGAKPGAGFPEFQA